MFQTPNQYRVRSGPYASKDEFGCNGAFVIPSNLKTKRRLYIICSDGLGWEHVSVHAFIAGTHETMTPLWSEMCQIKNLFWDPEDIVMQLHPRESEYINNMPNALHLWRPVPGTGTIPTPPAYLVGIK